jgi:uncharacterized protein
MRVVTDTNVLLSALLFGGITAKIHRLWKNGRIIPLANKEMMREYARVLTYKKFDLAADEISLIFDEEIFPYFTLVPQKKRVIPHLPGDRDDIPFLSAALDGKAAFLISDDAHLLALDGRYEFSVVNPGTFLELHG